MSSEVRVSPQSGPFEGEERLGHILRLDISAFLVERGFRWGGGICFILIREDTKQEGQEAPKRRLLTQGTRSTGAAGDVQGSQELDRSWGWTVALECAPVTVPAPIGCSG